MAGLWELVRPAGEGELHLNVSLLYTELIMNAFGDHTLATAQAILEADLGRAFTGDANTIGTELGDLKKLSDDISQGATNSKLVLGHRIQAHLNSAETGHNTESEFRTALGL